MIGEESINMIGEESINMIWGVNKYDWGVN